MDNLCVWCLFFCLEITRGDQDGPAKGEPVSTTSAADKLLTQCGIEQGRPNRKMPLAVARNNKCHTRRRWNGDGKQRSNGKQQLGNSSETGHIVARPSLCDPTVLETRVDLILTKA